MRLVLSPEPDIYGTIITDYGEIQVLLSESSEDGIRIIRGGDSSFVFFFFVPLEAYETLVENHTEMVFRSALLAVCELIKPR